MPYTHTWVLSILFLICSERGGGDAVKAAPFHEFNLLEAEKVSIK
jgi:hypothetical protein